jgi:zinc protease
VEVEGQRRSVADRIDDAQTRFFMPGTPVAERPVHGDPDQILRASPSRLQRLYRRHYVPQRATLIIVGDVHPDAVEAAVAARFSRWERRPSPTRDPAPSVEVQRRSETSVFIDPEAPTALTIAAVGPLLGEADAAAPRDRIFLAHLGCRMLARRLELLSGVASPDCSIYDHFRTARIIRIDVAAPDRDWRRALAGTREALAAALERGFTAQELAAEVGRPSTQGASRSSSALADAIAASLQSGTIFTEPQDLSSRRAYLAGVRVEAVNSAFRAAWTAVPGRLLFVSHNEAIPDPALLD